MDYKMDYKHASADADRQQIDWTPADIAAASAEGWDIFDCDGHETHPWQLQCFDSLEDSGWPPGKPYPFANDLDAWLHVARKAAEGSALHIRAMAVLQTHSPVEHDSIMRATSSAPADAGETHRNQNHDYPASLHR